MLWALLIAYEDLLVGERMKNRLIITISDIHSSKQYSVHEIIKKVILFTILLFVLIGIGTYIYIKVLNNKVTVLKEEAQLHKEEIIVLKETSETFKQKNSQLNTQNNELIHLIQESSDKLFSVNERLQEVEEMIGVGPDLNASFHARLEQERTEATESLRKEVQEEQVSNIQKTLLLNSIPNGKPLSYRRISSPFGYRTHPVTKRKSFHPALDLTAKHGTPIYAPASGVVVYAKKKGAYGNFLLLAHSYGFKTAYGHLSRFAVKSGEYVSKGDIIAYVGNTGRSTGPHLHYEIRYLDKWVDPKAFIVWDLDNINYITDKITKVKWKSILEQTKKLISLSTN